MLFNLSVFMKTRSELYLQWLLNIVFILIDSDFSIVLFSQSFAQSVQIAGFYYG